MRHQVLVDSRDRDFELYPHAHWYRLRLPRSYKQVTGARLLSADIPTSFFVFSASHGNTTIRVGVGGVFQDVTLPDGNYDTDTLPPELNTALRTAFAGKTFSVEVDPRTMQLVIECLEGDVMSVDTRGITKDAPTDWGLPYYLGFAKGQLTTDGTAVVQSTGVVNLNPFTYILLDIEELGTVDEGGVYGSALGKGTFAKIPINGISYEYIFRDLDKATEIVDCKPTVQKLETLTVAFRLHDGTPLDFRGVEHSFLLELITKDPPAPMNASLSALALQPAAQAERSQPKRPRAQKEKFALPPPPQPWWRRSWIVILFVIAGGGWWWWARR